MNASLMPIRTTVAHIIVANEKYLMVQEKQDGQIVINQPAGHIEPGEDVLSAVRRETLEETGLQVEPQGFLGIYQSIWQANRHYLRFCFVSRLANTLDTTPQDSDIIQAFWLSREEIFDTSKHQLRSKLVKSCLDDFAAKPVYPMDLVKEMIRSD